ncbi:hypothetical protein DFH07DRAFT_944113 [Mycena maculata]|uniref:Uncharacterized protein n=1 Tax=Mycena maculata TaxID=230809 RepID=A0AAD7IB23_9AGAR|nr:hypothetical protein DFH07DRAFT_944113 [Mycena maculata]
MSSDAYDAPSKATHGGHRIGSGRKSKEWHKARRREETERCAEELHAAAARQQSQPIQAPFHSVQPVASMATFFHQRNNTRGIAFQDLARQNSHPNHGLQVHSDPVNMSSNIESSPPSNYRITQDYFDRLVEEQQFLDLNDPNGDIASGENPIEDSLFDDIDNQHDAAPDAAAAAEETQKSEPPEAPVHHSYLQKLRTKTSSEIATHGQPDCSSRGQLFHYAKHPLFAVQDAIVSSDGLKPDSLYHLDVLIWIPHLLAKGSNSDPIARHVRRRPTDYFLLTNRYLCNSRRVNNPGCGQTYQGTDVHIFGQLPQLVQLAFPVYLSARSAIDKQMMGEVVSLFTSRVGPGPYLEFFSETQQRVHANLYGLQLQITMVSAKKQIANHTGKLKGEPIHPALYSVVNENEEVRATTWCLTKAMPFVQGLYKGIED